jgi:hypothetical protein
MRKAFFHNKRERREVILRRDPPAGGWATRFGSGTMSKTGAFLFVRRSWAKGIIGMPIEGRHRMNRAEFLEMHADCVTAMQTYFVQVEKTSTMLAECTAEPLTFRERFALLSQGIVENDAHRAYLGTRRLLLGAAQLGYGSAN